MCDFFVVGEGSKELIALTFAFMAKMWAQLVEAEIAGKVSLE